MATSEADIAAQLIERLLSDPEFRTEFRRDPASACRKAGLDELADEMSFGTGQAMMTLDQRESKSSLAGVMMAAAMEGVGIYQFGEHVLPHIDDVPSAVGDVLSRVSLPAIDLKGALAGGPDAPEAPADAGAETGAADAGAAAAAGGNGGAAAPEAPPEVAPPEEAAAAGEKADKAAEAKEVVLPPEQAAAGKAAAKIAEAESPEAKRAEEAQEAVAKIKEEAKDLPDASDVPDAPVAPQPVEEVGQGAGEPDGHDHEHEHEHDHGAEAPAAAAPVAPPEAAAAQPAAPAGVADAAAGSGGGGAAAEALLQNKNLVLDADAQKDIRDGAVDPRMIGLLGKLAEKHEIELSVIKTGHAQFTSGGSVSNHFEGRGIDIARVDGEIVNSGSPAARELASEIAEMSGDLRPTEVGTPWAIGASGFFTDGAHQDHLHVAYDGEPPPGFEAPAPAAAAAAAPGAPVAAAAAAAPGQPVAAAAALAEPKAKAGDSLSFRAVTAEDAANAAAGKQGDELSFMQPPAGPASAVAAGAVPAVVADAATATAGGSSGLGAAALETAKVELAKGVQEEGVNTGAEVDQYLKEAGVAPGNPWCASFVTWALAQNGHKMEGGGWAAVQTWVQNAEAGNNNLEVISAEDARPGDIVCYDWGGQEDFGSDGHIGFVASNVEGGKFTALEGNNQDRVMTVPRDTSQANVKFIRIKGDAPAGAAVPSAPLAAPPAGAPAPPAAVETPGGGSVQPAAPAAVEPSGGGAADVAAAATDATGANPYPGDDAPKEQIAAWMAKEAEKRGLPPQLPLMASLVESDMTNIQGGDADSVGYFQMRVGIWNQGEYAGYPKNPELQVKWFLDQAEQVKDARVAAGKPIDDPNSFGEWIADVERPAEQYRGRYQLELEEANNLLGSAATAPPAAAAAAVPAPGQPVAAAALAEPKAKPGDSLSFRAVTAEDAANAAAPKQGDELSFMQPPAGPASAIAPAGAVPAVVADAATATAGGSSGLGSSALEVAKKELAAGVKEEGTNTGAKVDEYLASAGVGPGNPWCASFVTWSLEQAGHKMDGGGWAGVQTWVRAAEAKTNDLAIVDAADARPGDIVVYDWGGQEDFGADGHIGFLASNVEGGNFTALEGNNQDAVMSVPRSTSQANVKFIRIGGDAPAGAPVASAPVVPAPGAPAPPAAVETPGGGSVQPAAPAAVEPSGGGAADVAAAATDATGANPYPGDDAPKEQIAAWMAKEAEKRGLPPQLPLMASLVESDMTNIQGGDADSVGYFQMRVGIWNQGEYAGYPKNPELQVKWFLDQAEQVKDARVAAGKPIDDPNSFGEWIADVERPAEQYRGRYQLELEEANNLLGTATAPPAAVEPAAAAASTAPAAADQASAADGPKKHRGDEMEFMSAKGEAAQEAAHKHHATVQFMKAVESKQQAGAAAAPGVPGVAAAAAAAPATGPTSAEDAAANQAVGAPVPEGELALQNVGAIGTYPGDNASQPQLAQWLASEAKKAGLPPELPVMASLVESGVQNLKGGDADSAGFFQMRVGIWDNGPYKGFRMNPQLQAKWFVDNALQVKKARLAAGKSVTDPGSYGEWIADIERPAAQYRYKYQLRLTEARKLLGG